MSEPLHVTFVCIGNFCRSVMAEKMFADQLRQRVREHLDLGLAGTVRAGPGQRQHLVAAAAVPFGGGALPR
ncbi:hypothetical protein JHV675_55040 [Mycobacterium avium subsp. hominissuis]